MVASLKHFRGYRRDPLSGLTQKGGKEVKPRACSPREHPARAVPCAPRQVGGRRQGVPALSPTLGIPASPPRCARGLEPDSAAVLGEPERGDEHQPAIPGWLLREAGRARSFQRCADGAQDARALRLGRFESAEAESENRRESKTVRGQG